MAAADAAAEIFTIGPLENKFTYRKIGDGVWQCCRGLEQDGHVTSPPVVPKDIDASNPGIFIIAVGPGCFVPLAGGGGL